jgi:hypothetical protein
MQSAIIAKVDEISGRTKQYQYRTCGGKSLTLSFNVVKDFLG